MEMDLDVRLNRITINWNPIPMNRFLRFIRFYKYPADVYRDEKISIQQSFKSKLQNLMQESRQQQRDPLSNLEGADPDRAQKRQRALQQMEQLQRIIRRDSRRVKVKPHESPQKVQRSNSVRVGKADDENKLMQVDKIQKRHSCEDDTTIVVQIRVAVQRVKIVAIHPQNSSYPVFTAKANTMHLDFTMH